MSRRVVLVPPPNAGTTTRSRRRWSQTWIFPLVVVLGCSPSASDRVVIATNWSASACSEVSRALSSAPTPIDVVWIRVAGSEDPTRILYRPARVDLVLGGPAASYGRLHAQKRLLDVADGGRQPWLTTNRRSIGLVVNSAARDALGLTGATAPDDPRLADRVTIVDPRNDSDGALINRLAHFSTFPREWASEYARLVRVAANARTVTRDAAGAVRELESRRAVVASLGLDPSDSRPGLETYPERLGDGIPAQGLGIVASSSHAKAARVVVEFLKGRGFVESEKNPPPGVLLLPDLLGSTLVDAQSELRAARRALSRESDSERALAWMTEAPPWPPASISRMRLKSDGAALIQTLAGQIAPDDSARDWLIRSWNRSEKPMDGVTLDGIATAAEGRLIAEPRFRAWLRAEWTAWARQRYRRVIRKITDPRFSTS
ncbi:MAG: hypothetical protein JWN86_3146 [Planctomycetota bacterium]|nr:hypothetical protein [Planctomycetota bacterium]